MFRTAAFEDRRYVNAIAVLLAGLAAVLAVIASLGDGAVEVLIRENGIIETASAFCYFVCLAAMILLGGWRTVLLRVPYISFILLFLALRELDADKRFTTMGIFKTEFYLSPAVPWIEKAFAVTFFVFLIWALIEVVDRHRRGFLQRLRRFDPVLVSVLLALALTMAAKSLDGLARKLHGFGLDISERGYLLAQAAEEVLELGIPLFLLLAVVAHFKLRTSRAEASDDGA